ncbi:phage tail tube protein [Ferrimonas pelagia]|uniref:Phage tail protein n=1 Tax=Ferrimonas pelagia TaxID=1177826 RepID=A0ABP9EL93_9GAMM
MGLTKRELILLKPEAVTGQVEDLDPATDAVLVEALGIANNGARMVERGVIKPTMGKEQSLFAGTLKEITFTAEVKGSGAAGTAPEIGAALRACGLNEEIAAGLSVTYAPVSAGHESVTIQLYQDGSLYTLKGCRGNVSFDFTAGGIAKASFTLRGHVHEHVDAPFPAASYASTVPIPLIGLSSLQVGGYGAEINQLTLDLGNEVVSPASIRSANGFGEVRIANRDPNGQIDPEMTALATKDWEQEWMEGRASSIVTGTVGSQPGNIFALNIPKAVWRDVSQGEREQVRTLSLPFGACESAGDDQFSLVFS